MMNILWLILSVLLWGFLHSLLASSSVKALTQRVFGAYFEERKLSREFGAQYAAYQALMPMLIPGLRLRRNKK